MTANIPPREPIGDAWQGCIARVGDTELLMLTPEADALVLAEGAFIVRYGVRYLGKPHLSIVPGMVFIDYGQMLTGVAAWEFLLKRSNLYPRAEIFGYRNDGRDEQMYVKTLDFALPMDVLVYRDAQAAAPLAQPQACIAPATAVVAPRILEYLPRYETLAAWQAAQN
jgi:hypothetical protein